MNAPFNKKLTRAQFRKKILDCGYEDLKAIDAVEKLLSAKRGYVSKLPPPGGSVILMLSGGMDSLTTWAFLMKEYKLHVFPFFMYQKPRWPWQENKNTREIKAVRLFSLIYQKKFPFLFHSPTFWDVPIQTPAALSYFLNHQDLFHPEQLLREFLLKKQSANINHFATWEFAIIHAVQFIEHNRLRFNRNINTLCTGILYGDGKLEPSQRYTSLRANTLLANIITGAWDKTIVAPFFEEKLGWCWTKSDVIRYGESLHLPLEKTWSCHHGNKIHCGTCPLCWYRKESFNKAGYEDKTSYFSPN